MRSDSGWGFKWGWVTVLVLLHVGTAWGAGNDALRRAAERGDATAQFEFGMAYANKEETPENVAAFAKWMKKAAEQGHSDAQLSLAVLYGAGKGVPQDWIQALMWLELAAARGSTETQEVREAFLARMTPAQISSAKKLAEEKLRRARWKEVPETSSREAAAKPGDVLRWLREGAEQGDPGAQFNYGMVLMAGDPEKVPRDAVQGLMWLKLACKGGPEYENAYGELIAGNIPGETLIEAERRAREWRPKK